jgi:hypothetical protein
MLPILRILPVGGVLLAILILVLALSPPDGSRPPLSPQMARGALVDRDRHPEVRQFLILAALKRADELNRLRELPDTPPRSADARPKFAGLPGDRSGTDPDETGSINETPGVSIPIEIGEPSSTELPVTSSEEKPPEVKKAERAKPQRETRRRIHRARYNRVSASAAQSRQLSLFETLFGGHQNPAAYDTQVPYQQSTYSTQQAGQQYQQLPYGPQQTGQSTFSTTPRTVPY